MLARVSVATGSTRCDSRSPRSLVPAVAMLAVMLLNGRKQFAVDLGRWVVIPNPLQPGDDLYHFSIKFVFDRLSLPFAILSFVLSGTIGAFATKYMHRERGYNRFFVLYAIFRYLYLIHEPTGGGNPDELLLQDPPLLTTIALWAITTVAVSTTTTITILDVETAEIALPPLARPSLLLRN